MPPSPNEPTVDASVFQGLFERALSPDAGFLEALRVAGWDNKRFQARYSTAIWRQCLEVARQRVCPGLAEEAGHRELGRRFLEGYFQTIIGKFVATTLPFVGRAGLLKRLAKYWSAGRTDVRVTPVQEAPQRWRINFVDSSPLPGFSAGVIEVALKRFGPVNVTVENATGSGFDIVASW